MVLNNEEVNTVSVNSEKEERWQTKIKSLKEGIAYIYDCKEFSDVIIKVESQEFKLHKLILAARSPYFEELFYKQDASDSIDIDSSIKGFQILIRYIYTDKLDTTDKKEILEGYRAAIKFQQAELITECVEQIAQWVIDLDNVYDILNEAFDVDVLKERCYLFIKQNSNSALQSTNFMNVQPIVLEEILSQNCFDGVVAKTLVDSVLQWAISLFPVPTDFKNLREFLMSNTILGRLRLHQMEVEELIKFRKSYPGLLTPEEILDLQDYVSQPGGDAVLPEWCHV